MKRTLVTVLAFSQLCHITSVERMSSPRVETRSRSEQRAYTVCSLCWSAMDYSSDESSVDDYAESPITSFANQISARNKYLQELECKRNQMYLALQRAMEDKDSLLQSYNEVCFQ